MITSSSERQTLPAGLATRILNEGFGTGAWHGPDLKAALADVDADLAFWRPAAGRHNIAEIAVHHAYYVRTVRTKIAGREDGPFVLSGDDWFELPGEQALSWSSIRALVESEHSGLASLTADVDGRTTPTAVTDEERLGLVVGITCHAVYHAGQIQLIKRLKGSR